MATIQVAMRCRPFTVKERLGVQLLQTSDEPPTSECNLLNSQFVGDRARFAFTYSWWSAFNYKSKCEEDDMPSADEMKMMSQPAVYEAVGHRMKADFTSGNAVVMFAYGLSGSGKTFTVFGPDAVDSPDAWFKHSTPHKLWGILPNMAYELFQEKKEDWKFTMKYFQNVVDIVRDLMSPSAQEKHYKDGMKKDDDGFMDITWCQSKVLHSWDDFRNEFLMANARKAISPTQFNHQSTRGHCVMTLELEKPSEDDPTVKQRCRLYVCDLAGTEPAGDIVYAQYKVVEDAEGNKEYNYIGPHPDQSKTKELQAQGMKINLSLSEMAQFFMKMAEAVVKNTLKPGGTIPGCNSFFLCKYLKDTLLQAKTYLFCAIRPEVSFHKYTFATLGFAKNASIIKVKPKKATTASTPGERKLMEQLEELKAAMDAMKQQNQELEAAKGGGDPALVASLQRRNDELQASIAAASSGGDGGGLTEEDMEAAVAAKVAQMQQMQEESNKGKNAGETDAELREKYARHGMKLAKLEGDISSPHFTNLDTDSFKNGVFLFELTKGEMTFGPNGDFRPQSLAVVRDHCTIYVDQESKVSVEAKQGRTYVNGRLLSAGERVPLDPLDRLVVGSEVLLLRVPGRETGLPISPEEAVTEFQEAIVGAQKAAGGGSQLEQSKQALQGSDPSSATGGLSEALQARIDAQLVELHPKMAQAKDLCRLIDPLTPLEFQLTLRHTGLTSQQEKDAAEVGVTVTNTAATQSVTLSSSEFNTCFSLLNDELAHMRDAVAYGGVHTIDTTHRPVVRFFDHMIHTGTCVQFTDILQYNMDTDPEDANAKILKVAGDVTGEVQAGTLWTTWTPEVDASRPEGTILEIDEPSAFVGKPWTYRFKIGVASGLPNNVAETYIEYNFFGERFTTEVKEYEKGTRTPDYEYDFVHHVECVTQEFLTFITKPIELKIYISPYVFVPPQGISTSDADVAARIRDPSAAPVAPAAVAQGGPVAAGAVAPAGADEEMARLRAEVARLQGNATSPADAWEEERRRLQDELDTSRQQVQTLENQKQQLLSVFPECTSVEEAGKELERLRQQKEGGGSKACCVQ